MNLFYAPSGPLRGTLEPPADKSISHRAAIVGAMSTEPVMVRNYLDAEDTRSTLAAIRSLGAIVEEGSEGVRIRGVGLRYPVEPTLGIDVGNCGTLMRLLPGWLAQLPDTIWRFDGDESIRRRPVDRIAAPLELMGARLEATGGRFAPFTVHGAALRSIEYELPVASAQVKSCVLFAGLATPGGQTAIEPVATRDHTERILAAAGVPVRREGEAVHVSDVDELGVDDVAVPADPSSAAFHVAAALLVPGSSIRLRNVGTNWTRTGFLRIAERMGGWIDGDLEPVGADGRHEPVSDLEVEFSELVGTEVAADEVPLAIDELPLVALLGCFAEGTTVVTGAEELRVKETDRIAAVVEELGALGAQIEATPDGFVVEGTGGLHGGRLHSRGDHRMAMLGAVAGLASELGVEVEAAEATAVSYPGFSTDLGSLAT